MAQTWITLAEAKELEDQILAADAGRHADDWQDAYPDAMSDAESGIDKAWASFPGANEVLAEIGPLLLSGCPIKLGRARDAVIRHMTAHAYSKADQTNLKTRIA